MGALVPEEQYLIDKSGNTVAVVVPVDVYRELVYAFEELECIQQHDAALAAGETPVPFEQAIEAIGKRR